MNTAYDYIIIGSGAGGSAAAYRLATAGKSVLLLEKGGHLPEDGSTLDPERVLRQGAFKSRENWRDLQGRPFAPEEFFNVGGKTKWYGAALLRFAPDEFGADPKRRFCAWPFPYETLAPYYAEVEQLLQVRHFDIEPGLQGIIQRLQKHDAAWHLQSLPLGLAADIDRHPEAAVRFDGFALPGGLKADAEHRLLGRLQALPNFHLLPDTEVSALLPAADSVLRLQGVTCINGQSYHARHVLLAAGALHSPRLLERYLSGHGLQQLPAAAGVGRQYKRHVLTAVLAFSWKAQRDLLRKTALLTHPRYPHSSIQPLGGWIDREILALQFPRWVPRWIQRLFTSRVYGFFLQTEDGSHVDNRVTAGQGGDPMLAYDLSRLPAANLEHRALVRGFMWGLIKSGLFPLARRIPLEGSAHSVGTLVTGRDPHTSVVNETGRVHGLQNLYVVDGSVLPRSGRMNPALTIYAWSLRVADALLAAGDCK